jgi:uncharacterized RDD family membrane protein YckC
MTDAGFWRRYAAWSLDAAVIGLPVALLCWSRSHAIAADMAAHYEALLQAAGRSLGDAAGSGASPTTLATQWLGDPALRVLLAGLQESLLDLLWPPLLAFALLGALYHAVFEASVRQATPGQRLLGLRVVDVAGDRIGVLRALLRHLAGALSWITLNLGHALALVAPQKRALHDYIAGTRMVQDVDSTALPAWAHAWLGIQALLLLWLTVVWYGATSHALQAAIDTALGI